MFPLSRTHWTLAILALVCLRLVIGFHFYEEGITKIKSGDFSAEGFFRNANGPLAPFYAGLIDDGDAQLRLGLVKSQAKDGVVDWQLDPLVTEETWKGFMYRAARIYGFGDPDLVKQLERRRAESAERLAKHSSFSEEQAQTIRSQMAADKKNAGLVSRQKESALAIVDNYIGKLKDLLAENQTEILAYFRGADRLNGFDQDGSDRTKVISGVQSLSDQAKQIKHDRIGDARPWLQEVNAMWDGVEAEINALAVADQSGRGPIHLERPWKPRFSLLKIVDWTIPWFDAIVGGLLVIGLFTRLASAAGALLLIGVISTQPPFFLESADTISQIIELAGLAVLFATCAGRLAGLDSLLYRQSTVYRIVEPQPVENNS